LQCLLASAGPLYALPSLLAPSALLRRASSLVGKTAPRRCARWPAPPAACWLAEGLSLGRRHRFGAAARALV